ncbi:MAG TPA: PHP domain-containing protein [Acidimicrobiia bacterium]|nr:PHP domain-containing protein [Acidimicrobiia bacterium]
MSTPRQDFGEALWRLSDLVRADERSRSFRAKAYRRAVWSLDDLAPDLSDPSERALSIPSIGAGVLRLIEEFRERGGLDLLDRLEQLYPAESAKIRRLPRMTPVILRALKGELGVDTSADLITAIEAGGVEALRGVGPATAERWAATLQLAPSPASIPSFQAYVLADVLGAHLRRHLGGTVEVAGAVRRMEEWVDTIDVVSGVDDVRTGREFLEGTAVARFIGDGPSGETVLRAHDGADVRVHVMSPAQVGTRLLQATGPPGHVEALIADLGGESLTETEIYARNARIWVPPPARALPAEIATNVVRLDAIRGDLHVHSDRSPDGRMSLQEIFLEAVNRGYEYVLITDHTSGLRFGGLDEAALEEQREEIQKVSGGFPDLLVLQGAELNIGKDGSLDIDDESLSGLDIAVAGLHSYFDLDDSEQTDRVVAALSHPVVRVLAHPTGRRIGTRPAIDIDLETVVAAAIEHDVALEVNGHRDRLDLSAELAAMAIAAGALLAANSDSHRVGEMGNVANSVATMQRGGVSAASVVNTMPVEQFRTWISHGSTGAQ